MPIRKQMKTMSNIYLYLSKHKKRCIAFLLSAVLLVFLFLLYFRSSSTSTVTVQPVENITNENLALAPRFSGIAEEQKITRITADSDKKIESISVKEGDEVVEGDILFTYDTELIQLDIDQAELDIQNIQFSIKSANDQIKEYQEDRSASSGTERLNIDAQIKKLQADINSSNYEISQKQKEADRLKAEKKAASVCSSSNGVIVSVGSPDSPLDSEGTMLIMRSGTDLQIQATAPEERLSELSEGLSVIVRSRTDVKQTWDGTITSVSNEPKKSQEGADPDSPSSVYSFIVSLKDDTDLIVGQHVTVEIDYGQQELLSSIWLPSGFVVQDNGNSYVWARDSRGLLCKKKIILGSYNSDLNLYEIKKGLSPSDSIAWPDISCKEGSHTQVNDLISGG